MSAIINFYRVNEEFGCFSNFSPHLIRLQGKRWPTSEHFFQAQKFDDQRHREAIRQAKSPMIAARMGRDRKKKLRRDWESAKVSVMTEAVRAKFTQHDDIRAILVSTGDAKIVEHTENDSYWGDGGDGSGRNMLGQVLMRIRRSVTDHYPFRSIMRPVWSHDMREILGNPKRSSQHLNLVVLSEQPSQSRKLDMAVVRHGRHVAPTESLPSTSPAPFAPLGSDWRVQAHRPIRFSGWPLQTPSPRA